VHWKQTAFQKREYYVNKMKKLSILVLVSIAINCVAQDVHFSQFNTSSFLLNPALVGAQNNHYKATLQRKSQWASVSIPFNTLSLSLERKDIFPSHSIGVQFLNDIAGDSRFKTAGVTLAYAKKVAVTADNLFSIGAEIGLFQRSVVFDDLVFNDPENRSNLNFLFPDMAIGIANFYEINKKMALESGIAFYHINKPRQSLIENDAITLNQKMNLHTALNYAFNNKLSMQPKLLFSNQDADKEFLLACDVNYLLEAEQTVILKLGIAERFNDATIFYFGAEIESLSCVVSYDVNTSNLTNASNNKGGFEFSVVYQWSVSKKNENIEQEDCPKYL
jgi:type IX secretion system PorP/SprF family membrane protein